MEKSKEPVVLVDRPLTPDPEVIKKIIENNLLESAGIPCNEFIELFNKHISEQEELIGFEGVLLASFTVDNQLYMIKWATSNSEFNRWLVFPVSASDYLKYLVKKITLLQVIKNAKSAMYLIDIDREFEPKNCFVVTQSTVPDSYLPFENSFYPGDRYK